MIPGVYMIDRTEIGQSVDALAEVLDTVHVEVMQVQSLEVVGELTCEAVEPFTVDVLLVLDGFLVTNYGGQRLELAHGDALAILRDARGSPPDLPRCGSGELVNPTAPHRHDGAARLLRCTCHIANPERNPLLGALPAMVRIACEQWQKPEWLEPTLAWIERELGANFPGARLVVNRLVELVWIQLVRTHIASSPAATRGWLRALSDPQIGVALSLIHDQPATQFSVAGLAHAAGMSRSAFASQFTRLVGEPPLHYVARWRMLKASQLLKENKRTLAEVALAVGYDSEAAFSKAFKRWSGQAPGYYRRDLRAEEAANSHALAG